MNQTLPQIHITSTYVAEPIRGPLSFLLEKTAIGYGISFAEFNQVFQETLDPQSESATNTTGVNLFLIRLEDLTEGEVTADTTDELIRAFKELSKQKASRNLIVFCPASDRTRQTEALEQKASQILNEIPGFQCLSSIEITENYLVSEMFDEESFLAGKIPYTDELYAALATLVVRTVSEDHRPPAKVIVLDADNTLWGGVVGEDDPAALVLDGVWAEVHNFFSAKQKEGFLLALCSKNNQRDVENVFSQRSAEIILTREQFAGWKANWLPKSENIRALADEFNLALSSFVFIDDNPAEVAEVEANCPQVTAVCLPKSQEEVMGFLRNLWSLDKTTGTTEDASRTEFYQSESERRDLQTKATSFEEFLTSLNLKTDIQDTTEEELPRISQLSLRTNQFNANPIRLTEGELKTRISEGANCLSVRVSDRFGDYGLVAAILFSKNAASLNTELFLLSCRALGKGVERRMLISLAEKAHAENLDFIEIRFRETERNEPCRNFLRELNGEFDPAREVFRISTDEARSISPFPPSARVKNANSGSITQKITDDKQWPTSLFLELATTWRAPGNILAELKRETKGRPELTSAFVKPGTAIQKQIATIWKRTLGMEDIGIDDPFAELGGDSIQLVAIHSELQREFGLFWELPELFTLPTIATIEARILSETRDASKETITVSEEATHDDSVAIIGLSLRVPGASDPEEFWNNLVSEKESLSRFQRDELEFPEEYDRPDFVPVKGIIEDIDKFDASFFGILPKDAEIMDPQQRIFLELAWEAMERSGYQPDDHKERIGVYAGAYFDSYLLTNLCTNPDFLSDLIPQIQVGSLQTELGNDKDYLATRVAFKLNLKGPAMTMQTACSTSAVAIAEACRAIRDGVCDMALAGGVTVTLPYKRGYFYTEQGMLSRDGQCRPFDEKASGTVFGNGAGVVMLKRLSDAVRDRDHIHAVIRGTGINNDGGVKHSYTAPSVDGQVSVIQMAHRDAGIDPSTITAIEAHGTGTPLGDPIEVNALTKAFRSAGVTGNQFCAIGSLKSNIGHLDVASGVCGVIKSALSLEKKTLPALLHFNNPNPKIDFANSPFFPNAETRDWEVEDDSKPRRAGVSSFGVGGTNVHLVLEEAPEVHSAPSPREEQLFLLSARTESALEKAAANLADFANHNSDVAHAADVAWTLATGRKNFRNRRAVVARDLEDLAKQLSKPAGSSASERSNPPVHFLFPGQGSQHILMAEDFYRSEPRFKNLVDHCSEFLEKHLGESLTELLFPQEEDDHEQAAERLKNTSLAQPAIFAIEYALADLWMHWGVNPETMIGHSVGEFVAACHAGVFTLEEGLTLLAQRGKLMGDLPQGGMLSVRLSEEELLPRLPETLDLAAVNSPEICVVAGPEDELASFANQLQRADIVAKPLHTSHAFHSRMMDPVIPVFADCFASVNLKAPKKKIFSTVTGDWLTDADATDPHYWSRHLRETVRFSEAVTNVSQLEEEQIFLEVGPGKTLSGLALQSIGRNQKHTILSTCRHLKEEGSDHSATLQSLGKLWTSGVEVDWRNFYGGEIRKRIPLPTYPFERKRHWVDPGPIAKTQQGMVNDLTLLPPQSEHPTSTIPTAMEPNMSTNKSRTEAIGSTIREILTNLSGIPEEDLTGDATYLELGFDSLLLTQVSKAFQDEFGTQVKMRQLMTDFSTIDSMVEHLDATLPEDQFHEETAAAASPAPDEIAPVEIPAATIEAIPLATTGNAPRGTIEAVISQQMSLMQQQLALLQGVPQVATPTTNPPPPAKTKPQTEARPAPAENQVATSAPTTKIDREIDDSLTEQQSQHLEALIHRYTEKTKGSKELTEEYRQWYADPRTVSNFNRLWKEMIYQIVVKKSKGSRLIDIDGNEYIDILNGFGPGFLGHSPDRITSALHNQLDQGVEVGPQSQTAMEASKLFCELTGNERASFVNTGSEAVQAAMRLSRTVIGRDKIVVFEKDYHGNFDEVLVRGVRSGEKVRTMPSAPGIPNRAVDDVIVLPYGTEESLEMIRDRAHELAAVIVEPIQSRRPEFQPKEFIREVRRITAESGTTFVFDEVITGFRTGPRGAQEYFGVEADIATYGKVVGAGMPVGVVAGKAEWMDTFDGGQWQYGDDSFPEKDVTFFAGTFVRHPLAMAAVKEMLLHLKESGPQLWIDLKEKANRLAGTVNQMFVDNEVPFRMPNFGSQMFVRHIDENKYANLLFFHMREKGVFLLEGFPSYLTTAHTDEDVDYIIAAFRESVAEMQEAGFFNRPATATIDKRNGSRLTGPPPKLLAETAVGESDTAKKPSEGTQEETFPLTEPLAEIWLASQVSEKTSLCFNEVVTLSLRGEFNQTALKTAIQDLTDRHEALRATFLKDGDGFRIQKSVDAPLPLIDLSKFSKEERSAKVEAELARERSTVFNLETGPLFLAKLIRLSASDHVLLLNVHHLVCDGWSYNVLLEELSTIYEARANDRKPDLPPAPLYSTFAKQSIKAQELGEDRDSEAYWLSQFTEPIPRLSIPSTIPGADGYESERIIQKIDADTVARLRKISGASGATLFATFLSTFQILLGRVGRQNKVITAFPAAGQNAGKGNERLVGHCVNFLPFSGTLKKAEPFSEFLSRTQENLLDGFEHQDLTLDRLNRKLPSHLRPHVEAVFNLERMDGYAEFPGLETSVEDISRMYSMNPLFLNALETEQEIELHLTYQTSCISKDIAEQWLESYRAMLDQILSEPAATVASVGSAISERQCLNLEQWNETTTDYPGNQSISELFDSLADQHSTSIALKQESTALTYRELSERADQIASLLVERNISFGDRVGIFFERSPDQIAALFAVLKIGGIYVPIDPEYPEDRIRFLMDDCEAEILLTQQSLLPRIPSSIGNTLAIDSLEKSTSSLSNPPVIRNFASDSPACIIYTSGSTGTPKGSLITHRGIVRLVRDTNYCNLDSNESILHAASICFDASHFEIFGPLLNGGTIVLPPAGKFSIESISQCIRDHKVTTLWLTSGLFQLMVEEDPGAFSGVKQLLTGGDVVPVVHCKELLNAHPDITLINGYGPTENTTFTTTHRITSVDLDLSALPIGRPIANTSTWILDEDRKPVAPGVAGELCTGGTGLAIGYLHNEALTSEKFIEVETPSGDRERVYRTGDLCRFRPDGIIEFFGRIDEQTKVRGFRVEPGEIESVLTQHPEVGGAKVVVKGDTASTKALIAYVAKRNGVKPDAERLRGYLQASLPDYMVPSSYIVLDELPVTPNGKIDTAALANAQLEASTELQTTSISDEEQRLIGMWESILNHQGICPDDDFFALGGHSLLGMKLFSRIQRELGVSLPLSVLFKAPTVRLLAAEIAAKQKTLEVSGYTDLSAPEREAIQETIVQLKSGGTLAPLFGVHGGDGGIFFYRDLAEGMNNDRPFYAFEAAVLTNGGPVESEPIETTAARYVAELNKVQPSGPVNLCGYSFGGVVAYEMARQLSSQGREIQFLGLVDTENPRAEARRLSLSERLSANWSDPNVSDCGILEKAAKLGKRVGTGLGYRLKFGAEGAIAKVLPTAKNMGWIRQAQVRCAYEQAMAEYVPGRFRGNLTLFRATECQDKFDLGEDYHWGDVVDGHIEVVDVAGNHISLFHKENIGGITNAICEALRKEPI